MHVQSFVVYVRSGGNSTRCKIVVRVLWCVPISFGWFLRVPYQHALVFCSGNFLCLVPAVFISLFFSWNSGKKKVGGELG